MKKFNTVLLMLVLGFIFLNRGDVLSQEAGTGFFRDVRATPLFPQGIIFYFDAIIPVSSEIGSITLLVESEDTSPLTLTIPLDDESVYTRIGDSMGVQYLWEFSSSNAAPNILTDVNYQWTLRLNSGEIDTAQDVVEFTDARAQWAASESVDIPIRVIIPNDTLSVTSFFESMMDPYNKLLNLGVLSGSESFGYMLYTDDLPIICDLAEDGSYIVENLEFGISRPCDVDLANAIYERSGVVTLQTELSNLVFIQTAITQDIVARAYSSWDSAQVPAWFRVGFARLLDPTPKVSLLYTSILASRKSNLFSLDELLVRPTDNQDVLLWEAQSYGLLIFIAERFGLDVVYSLAESAGAGGTFTATYEGLTGESIAALYRAWKLWIFSDSAPSVYGISLYGAATLTPTRVLSPTSPPPTRTPPPTFTPTDTPTVTLTFTPLPPTVTVTPRSARDIFTPTPSATATPVTVAPGVPISPQMAQYILIGLGILAGVFILLGALMSRNR